MSSTHSRRIAPTALNCQPHNKGKMKQDQESNKQEATRFRSSSSRERFTLIANKALRNPNISYRAKGILAACLSHAENFEFTRKWIEDHGTEGRDAIISALKELRANGYLKNFKLRNAEGRIMGEYYKFSDEVEEGEASEGAAGAGHQRPADQRPGNQRTEKPDAGKPVRNRRPPQRRPIEENHLIQENPPICPPLRSRARARVEVVELPDWLEGHREHLERWLENRRKKHRSSPEITKLTLKGLMYAKELGVLAEYCEYASEMNWMSLGFAGHRELVQKLAKEHGKAVKPDKPVMADIVYTLGVDR